MLQTHERDIRAGNSPASQVNPLDLLGTNVPSISVRLDKLIISKYLREKPGFHSYENEVALFRDITNYINYQLQKEFPLYFLTVSAGNENTINIKNAFQLLDEEQMAKNETDETDAKSLYKTLHAEISSVLNRILSEVSKNASLLKEFVNKTITSDSWDSFVEARRLAAAHDNVADALVELNNDLKLYFLDGEFLSVDRYNSNIPAIYLYDCQCRVICMFSLQTAKRTIESVVKACAAISCDGEAHGQLFYSKNAEIRTTDGMPAPSDVTEQYVRVAYKNEITEWVNQVRAALNEVDATENFLMIELQEIVVNRFYNGFVVGHFLSNERAYNASKMAVAPPKISYK